MSAFVTRRALDQLYISCAYQHNTVNIYASDPGFCSGFDGGTHTCFEDLAVMRTIPVSYTHLDVYKRQGLSLPPLATLQKTVPSGTVFFIGYGNHRLCRWRIPVKKSSL